MNTESFQLSWIRRSRGYVKTLVRLGIKPGSVLFNLNTWSPESVGYNISQLLNYRIHYIIQLVKSAIISLISNLSSYYYALDISSATSNCEYKRVFITWAKNSDICDNIFLDRYSCTSTTDFDNVLWILIFIEPVEKSYAIDNTIIFAKFSIYRHLKSFLNNSKKDHSLGLKNKTILFRSKISSMLKIISIVLEKNKVESIFMPYEAQPLHQAIFAFANSYERKIESIGYIHSFLPSLPSEYHYRDGCPNKLLINGSFQSTMLTKYLNWPKSSIIPIPALRYNTNKYMPPKHNCVYLPFDFEYSDLLLKSIRISISIFYANSISRKLLVRNHPLRKEGQKHQKLILYIEKCIIKEEYKRRRKTYLSKFVDKESESNEKLVIVVGCSAVVFELLQQNSRVIHVTSNACFDVLSRSLWNTITTKCVDSNVYLYDLIEPNLLYDVPRCTSSEILNDIMLPR